MDGGIVRIARRHRRLGIMSFTTSIMVVATPDGWRLARRQSARLSAD